MDNDRSRGLGPRCDVDNCRSRTYEEGEDGYLYCQNGHRKGPLLAGEDDDMFSSAARPTTRLKSDDGGKEKVSKYLKGPKAFDLYLKSLQLILRHQVWFLVHEKGLPEELETVVQDLWALRILRFESKLATDGPEFASSQPFSASDTDDASEKISSRVGTLKKLMATPNLIDCLALCYLGIITLRLPVTPGDLYSWTTDGKMAYRRAIKLLPLAMKDRLPANYHAVLDPNSLLSLRRFYDTLIDLQASFENEYDILWPPLNIPVLLFRYLKELALPLELYDATVRLGKLLEYDFAFHTDKKQLGIRHLPEAQLVACLLVCVQLLYPFDSKSRIPKSNVEPTSTAIDWVRWCATIDTAKRQAQEDNAGYTVEELTKLEEKDIFSMTGNQLDQYLDFYLANFLDEANTETNDSNGDFRNALYEMFPIANTTQKRPNQPADDLADQNKFETVRAVHEKMTPVIAIADGEEDNEVLRPGQEYRSYKKEKNLPETTKKFYEEAAGLTGLSVDMLLMAISHTEARIDRWRRRERDVKKRTIPQENVTS